MSGDKPRATQAKAKAKLKRELLFRLFFNQQGRFVGGDGLFVAPKSALRHRQKLKAVIAHRVAVRGICEFLVDARRGDLVTKLVLGTGKCQLEVLMGVVGLLLQNLLGFAPGRFEVAQLPRAVDFRIPVIELRFRGRRPTCRQKGQ